MNTFLGREPALIIGAVNALIALGVGFGLDVTPEQVGLLNAAVAAVLAVLVRHHVTPASTTGGEDGQADLVTICVVIIAVIALLWAFGVVPE
jgi:hypothetical protein